MFTYREHPSYAGFSSFFRYKLLLERGGWWVDTDSLPAPPGIHLRACVFQPSIDAVSTQTANSYVLGEEICFASNGNARQYMRNGWSAPEVWGTWTEGEHAALYLPLKEPVTGSLRIMLESNAYVRPGHPELCVSVVLREEVIASWRITREEFVQREIHILDLHDLSLLRLDFYISQPASPADLGESGDARKLGLGFRSLRVEMLPAIEEARAEECEVLLATTP